MQRYTIRLFLQNALHVLGGSSAHHQELKLYTQHRVFVKPLLLPLAVVEEFPKILYMFQAVPPPIIRSSKTIHTASGIC
jgi:hypothetical protein